MLSRGWRGFVLSHGLQLNDMLVFSLKYYGLQVKIYKAGSSTLIPYLCPRHSQVASPVCILHAVSYGYGVHS